MQYGLLFSIEGRPIMDLGREREREREVRYVREVPCWQSFQSKVQYRGTTIELKQLVTTW